MKVIIDILTPKQCFFFSKLSKRLEEDGHQVFRTTRKYREVVQLLKLKEVDAKIIGRHGGGTLIGKLRAHARRVFEMASLIEDLKPDVAVSLSSPEMARVSYGLGVPHVCVNDSPHAEAVARLTIPLSKRLLTPAVIPKKVWMKYGISTERIIQYDALDPWVWLKDFKPDKLVLKELNLDENKPTITFRTEESFAAYLLGKTPKKMSIIPIVDRIIKERSDIQVVILPRYKVQISTLKRRFKNKVILCRSVIDGPSLLHYTSIFVGAGGTMTTEAALLGVPTFSCYPDKSFLIEEYLIKKNLIIKETVPEKVTKRIINTLDNLGYERKKQKERAWRLVKKFEDPVEVILNEVKKVAAYSNT